MPLCGSIRCGCTVDTSASTADPLDGFVPTIDVTGTGTVASPYSWVIDEDWANAVAAMAVDVADLQDLAPDGIWQLASVTVDQGASTNIAHSGYEAWVWLAPYTVAFVFRKVMSGAGTGGSAVSIDLPEPAVSATAVVGHGQIRDTSTSQVYVGQWFSDSTSTIRFYPGGSTYGEWGANPNLALASTDVLMGSMIYQTAAAS